MLPLIDESPAARACALAREVGFDDAAVVPATTSHQAAGRLHDAIAAGRLEPFEWMTSTADQRERIHVRYPWAKSVLVVVASYYTGDPPATSQEPARAKVARYAWGKDYHHILRRKLRRLRKALLADVNDPAARVAPFMDSEAVFERAWAEAAGLGFVGKSSMLIHPQLGTYTFLGGVVTSFDLGGRVRAPVPNHCGTCTACLDACPTQAITAPFVVDARRCLVTWNVEYPTDPRGDDPALVGHGYAVGCDVCQDVCPWNRFKKHAQDERFLPIAGHVAFSPDEAPTDVAGTPLARPGAEVLPALARRALQKRA